jgi:sec-independent protein translocase protein TatA
MLESLSQLAFIGPGGPEFIVIMLVLLLMFGAKDAPRIFRKLNEMLNQVRNTADSFKREIMYGDLNSQTTSPDSTSPDDDTDYDHNDDYDYGDEYYGEDYQEAEERDYSDETFQELEKDLEDELNAEASEAVVEEKSEEEDGDAQKT